MEIADDYKPFADFLIYRYNYVKFENMAKLQILNMALNTGYYQNDLHLNNILVNPKYTGMYQDIPGKVIIIDFGLAIKTESQFIHRRNLKQSFWFENWACISLYYFYIS